MSGWLWFCLCLYVGLLFLEVDAKKEQRKFRFVLDQFLVKHLAPDLFKEVNCQLTQSQNRSFLNCNVLSRRNIEQAEFVTDFDLVKPNNQTMRLFHTRMDLCQYFVAIHKVRIFRIFAESYVNKITGSLKCPIQANFNYTLNNWYLDENDFPNYVPESNIRIFTQFYTNSRLVVKALNRGRVIYKH